MPSTRSSGRSDANSSPASAKGTPGTKRKADAASPSSKSKRGRPSKGQQTLEETLTEGNGEVKPQAENGEVKPQAENGEEKHVGEGENGHQAEEVNGGGETSNETNKDGESKQDADKALKDSRGGPGLNALDKVKASDDDPGKTSKSETETETEPNDKPAEAEATTGDAIQEDEKREEALPSNVLEKGLIYFFTRGRVGVDDPDSVQDLQRSYFVLRPLPDGAKITEGSVQDLKNNRLIALPKKVWPKSGRDRFMVFVEKAQADIGSLKEEFFQGSEYSTKTTGTRHTPPITPIGEGVYAITSTGSGRPTTHLAYMLTIPDSIGDVQQDVGLAKKGSFVLSLKNPEASSPANAALPQKADFPKEFIEEFSGRGWMPAHPKHLEYANAQILLIGEDFDTSDNLEPSPKDEKDESKETPGEELAKLEDEDEHRVERLKGDDSVFADLEISSKDYPKVMTTW